MDHPVYLCYTVFVLCCSIIAEDLVSYCTYCKRKHVELEPNVFVRSPSVGARQKLYHPNKSKKCIAQRQNPAIDL